MISTYNFFSSSNPNSFPQPKHKNPLLSCLVSYVIWVTNSDLIEVDSGRMPSYDFCCDVYACVTGEGVPTSLW